MAFNNAASRQIMAALMAAPRSVKQLSHDASLPLASVYRHVKSMQERGLVIVERSAMTHDGKPYDLYRARVDEAVLRISGQGVEYSWRVDPALEDRILQMWNYLGA